MTRKCDMLIFALVISDTMGQGRDLTDSPDGYIFGLYLPPWLTQEGKVTLRIRGL